MSLEFDDNYHIWKIKLELAQQGSMQALEQIKSNCIQPNSNLSFIENNFHETLKNSQIKFLKQNQIYGEYQLYSEVPLFLLLEGDIELKCLNLEGDEQEIETFHEQNVIFLNKQKMSKKFGQSNINIITKFHLNALTKTIIIVINDNSRKKIENQSSQKSFPSQMGLREQSIMKKYMLFPLKYIRIEQYQPKLPMYQEKFYLLEGRACYYYHKSKERYLISVYEQGYINPKQFQNTDIKLYLFAGAKILIFEEEFLKDDVVGGVELKRGQHIKMILAKYEKITPEQRRKIQIKLINNYKLQKKVIEREIFGIVLKYQANLALTQKTENMRRILTKNDLISTSSSIKQKCRIRISKKSSRMAV